MSQSTIWTQLAAPKSPIGTVPFVGQDGVTIATDAGYLSYNPENGPRVPGTTITEAQLSVGNGLRMGAIDFTGVPATSYTINLPLGKVVINGNQKQVTITNNLVFNTSLIFTQLLTLDATLISCLVPSHGNGSFIIQGNAIATTAVLVMFMVVNVYSPA